MSDANAPSLQKLKWAAEDHPRYEWRRLQEEAGLNPEEATERLGLNAEDVSVDAVQVWAHALQPKRTDMEKAAQALGRLRDVDTTLKIDLRRANLQGFDLHELNFEKADLSNARLEGANLSWAKMEGANLKGAKMEGADLSGAEMEGANLRGAEMEGADLIGAEMEGADLSGANLKSADLTFWTCARTNVRSADFSEAKNMTQDQVNALFGDTNTKLPAKNGAGEPLFRTNLLDRDPLDGPWGDDPEYDEWLAAGAPPGTPIKPR